MCNASRRISKQFHQTVSDWHPTGPVSRDTGLSARQWVSERIPGLRTGRENTTETEPGGQGKQGPASTDTLTLCPLPRIPALPALGHREMARRAALQHMAAGWTNEGPVSPPSPHSLTTCRCVMIPC